ncbi:hypothetical protein OEZ86_008449 [Tetradesmus obliquus]|nr:hypothetical protein OEZ86_008449 [Tetradesmus obliquus]
MVFKASSTAALTCNACPAGRELTPDATPPACRLCAAGSISAGGLLAAKPTCSACSGNKTTVGANRFTCSGCKPGFGAPSCDVCKRGFWSRGGAATNATACRACPDGTTTLVEGSTAPAACVDATMSTPCVAPPASSLWQLPAGVGLAVSAWQRACSQTPQGLSCTAAACDKGAGELTATCGQDGKWTNGTGSCNAQTCEKAASPAFPTNGATFDAAAWAAACGSTLQGNECATSAACSAGQKLSATCEYLPVGGNMIATWTKLTGSCTAAAGRVRCTSPPENVPSLNGSVFLPEKWSAICGDMQENGTCTAIGEAACSKGGSITAKCVKGANGAGIWTDVKGGCGVADRSGPCRFAPVDVQTPRGSMFLAGVWTARCGETAENATCVVVDAACLDGGTISAKCVKGANGAGVWTDVQGSCNARASGSCGTTPMPSAVAGWTTNGAPLDTLVWLAACSQTAQGQTCSAAACGAGFTGTLSAVCQADGQWGQLSGTCTAGTSGTCSGAPLIMPTPDGGAFSATAWAVACGSTARGSSCTTDTACSAGTGSITATCDATTGIWRNAVGSCSGGGGTGACATTSGVQGVANIDLTKWLDACKSKAVGETCWSSSTCKDNTIGLVSATCSATGWINASGTCTPLIK